MCPDHFQDLTPNSEHCWMIKADTEYDGRSWGDAHTECFAYGANLASIHSDEEMFAITSALKDKKIDVWVGLQANSKYNNICVRIVGVSHNIFLLHC